MEVKQNLYLNNIEEKLQQPTNDKHELIQSHYQCLNCKQVTDPCCGGECEYIQNDNLARNNFGFAKRL